jgi:hypothetical protein
MLGCSPAVLPRFLVLAAGCLLASVSIALAADSGSPPPPPSPPSPPSEPATLVVPDVRKQAFVFAKGALEDAGLAWKVGGSVEGYAANVVEAQSPAPGTRLVDTGAPLITLQLSRNPGYKQEGEPENASPYPGTALQLADAVPKVKPEPTAATPEAEPEAPKPAAKPVPSAAAAAPKPAAKQPAAKPAARPPAFAVPGAPTEPLDEIALAERAERLARWLDRNPKPTDANVRHWLYQHEWIVTGAGFGWWQGEQALVKLIAIDRRVEAMWGIGTRSRLVAQRALAEVRERSK